MGCNVKVVELILIIALAAVASCGANVTPKLKCTEDIMRIEIPTFSNMSAIYLEQLKDYPERSCQPKYDRVAGVAIIELSLQDVFQCGVTRVVNQLTGKRVYYHKVVIETTNKEIPKEILSVKCAIDPNVSNTFYNHTITKRNVLPAGFKEDEQLEVLKTFEKEAPKPELGVNVRQGDVPLNGGQLHVAPGTPLQMEIFLDEKSSPIYGLLVKEMQVTDTKSQEETIIFNGCSVDPYLFDNFYTVDGDFLAAKFRAFKFPESTYVQFRGTVNVCLDKCKGIECSNGILGYGRKKREVSSIPPDPNKIFEMTIMSFIKVRSENGTENSKPIINDKHKSKLITGSTSSKEERSEQVQNEKANNIMQESPSSNYKNDVREEIQYTAVIAETVSSAGRPEWLCGSFLVSCLVVLYLQ